MLELRPTCEHCNKLLPNTSTEAMICSYECTYCKTCATEIFKDVCPSCGGNFQSRPIRPKNEILDNPASTEVKHIPKSLDKFKSIYDKYKDINPEHR